MHAISEEGGCTDIMRGDERSYLLYLVRALTVAY